MEWQGSFFFWALVTEGLSGGQSAFRIGAWTFALARGARVAIMGVGLALRCVSVDVRPFLWSKYYFLFIYFIYISLFFSLFFFWVERRWVLKKGW
jgi:hypothetical protein